MYTLPNVRNSKHFPYDWKTVPTHGLFTQSFQSETEFKGMQMTQGNLFVYIFCPEFTQSPMSCNECHREEYIVYKIILLKRNISTSASVQFHPAQTAK